MSQDDQRNQPNEENAGQSRPAEAGLAGNTGAAPRPTAEPVGAGPVEPAGASVSRPAGATVAPAAEPRHAAPHRDYQDPGDGVARYADRAEEIPSSGSEQSWSAQPHPGYQPDPARHVSTRRLLIGGLVGLVVLGAGSFAGYTLLLAKSSNGNGPAPWTAAVKQDGAVVGGINAQNNGAASPVDLPNGASFGNSGVSTGAAINQAVTACRTATATSVPVTTATGTGAEIHAWSVKATPTVTDLHAAAGTLQRALTTHDVITVASASYTLCLGYPAIATVPPMPDAIGSQAWSAAVRAYALASTESLRGVTGNPDALSAANDNIDLGNAQLAALSARVNTAS